MRNESEQSTEGQGQLTSSVISKNENALSSQAGGPAEGTGKAMERESAAPAAGNGSPKAEASSPPFPEKKTKPVLLYIGVMFAAALLLLLFSFLIQQRNHDALMEGLNASAADMQTIVDLERETAQLKGQLEDAQETIDTLTAEKAALEEELAALAPAENDGTAEPVDTLTLERQRDALSELLTIFHVCYVQGNPDGAKLLLNDYQNERKFTNLPPHSAVNSTVSPSVMYEALVKYLNEQ